MTDCVLVLTTFPADFDVARLARDLVEARLAACVTILPVESTYRWQDVVQQDREQQLVIKTTAARADDVREHVRLQHPYDVPELLVLPVVSGHAPYLTWIRNAVTS